MGLIPGPLQNPGWSTVAAGRSVDVGLAVCLGIAPLLPTGPKYIGFPSFTYIDLVLVPLALLWAVGRLQARREAVQPWPVPIWAWHLTIAAVVGAAILGLMADNRLDSRVFFARLLHGAGDLFRPMNHTAHPLYSLRVALTFVEGWLVFLIIADLCRRAPDPHRRARAGLAGWLAGLSLVSALAILQYLTEFQLHHYWVKANPNIVRAHSTLDDPNALGAYLVLGIGLLVGLLRLGEARRRWLWTALLGLAAAALLTTMSRAALGAAVLGPLGVLAFVPRPVTRWQRTVRTTGRMVIAVVVLVVLTSAVSRLFIAERTRTQPKSATELVIKTLDPRESVNWVLRGRLPWWGAALGMFRDHPSSGVGLGRYPRAMAAYGGGSSRENTHNLYLQLFAEAGAPGGIAFLALCISLCLAYARKLRHDASPQAHAMALGGLIASISFLMTLLTGHTLLVPSGQVLFASFTATVAGLASWKREEEGRAEAIAPSRVVSKASRWSLVTAMLVVVLWYPAAGIVQGVGPRPGSWGYEWGLFPPEQAGGGITYRWTSGRALLDLDVPQGSTGIELPVAAPSPIRDGGPVRLRATADDRVRELVLSTADVQTMYLPFENPAPARGRRVLIEIDVRPTFVPSRIDPQSRDQRVLGIQLLRPRFVIGGSAHSPE